MTGVEADADARRAADAVDDRREMLEAMSEVGSLSGRVLEQNLRASAGTQREDLHQRPRRVFMRVHAEPVA